MIRHVINTLGLALLLVLQPSSSKAQTDISPQEQAELLKNIQSAKGKLELNSIWRKIISENPQYKDQKTLVHAAYVAKNALLLTQGGFFEESLQSLENSPVQPISTFSFAYEFNAIMILDYDWNISKRAMEGYRDAFLKEKNNLYEKPDTISKEKYITQLDAQLATMDDRLANMYYHTGDLVSAKEYIDKALKKSTKIPHVNELYVTLLPQDNKAKIRQELERFVVEGAYTPKMKTMLQELYIGKDNAFIGKDNAFETYFSGLETAAGKKVKADLAKKLIKEKASNFNLKNLEGKTVNLADYRGKTVVLDFWATWCGPCIMSFPTMTKARDLFIQEGKDVVFLFVDTGEKDSTFEGIQPKVLTFLKEKPYTLDVLFDLDNSVQKNYKITGLPTKLFIDPKGNIRYRNTGFDFDQKKAILEMRSIIELIQ